MDLVECLTSNRLLNLYSFNTITRLSKISGEEKEKKCPFVLFNKATKE